MRHHPSFLARAKRSFPFWFGGIWLLCGIPFLLIGLYVGIGTLRDDARFEREGRIAQGMVLTKRIGRSRDSQGRKGTSYWVGYRFNTADGTVVKREAQVGGRLWHRLVEREPVAVTYLSDRPHTSRIENEGADWLLPGVFTLLGLVFAGAGGVIFARAVRGILRELRLREEGAMAEATVVDVGPANVSFNDVPQWRIVYRYTDHRGRVHDAESNVMPPEEAQAWKPGDKATARFDTRAPSRSIWVGKA